MDLVLTEWLSAAVRWLHVVAGIAWIGSSFYFIHLDLSLRRRDGVPEGVQGEAGKFTAAASTTWSSTSWRRRACRTS
jgi:uncharacterized membrane protein